MGGTANLDDVRSEVSFSMLNVSRKNSQFDMNTVNSPIAIGAGQPDFLEQAKLLNNSGNTTQKDMEFIAESMRQNFAQNGFKIQINEATPGKDLLRIGDSRFSVGREKRILERPGEEGPTPDSKRYTPQSYRDTPEPNLVNPVLSKRGSIKLCFASEKRAGTP